MPPPKDKSKKVVNPKYEGMSEGRIKNAKREIWLKNRQKNALGSRTVYERTTLPAIEKGILNEIEEPVIRECVIKILDDIDRKMKIHFSIDYNVRRHMTPEAKDVKLPNGGIPYNHVYNWVMIILTKCRTQYCVFRIKEYTNNDVIRISWV